MVNGKATTIRMDSISDNKRYPFFNNTTDHIQWCCCGRINRINRCGRRGSGIHMWSSLRVSIKQLRND
jgi:hypothetical protein